MAFNKHKIKDLPSLDGVEKEIFSADEIIKLDHEAKLRAEVRRAMAESVSSAVKEYLEREGIGFNEFQRRLGASSATVSNILKGNGNLTLDTIASISQLIGASPKLVFKGSQQKIRS